VDNGKDLSSQFQQMATPAPQPDPKAQPSAPAAAAPAAPATPSTPSGDLSNQFSQMEQTEKPAATTTGAEQHSANDDNSEAAKELARKQGAAKHGILARAWDWVNEPILDNVLPEGVKTADVIKAAAFEKMYNEAYIPGVNDFNTKAATHFEPAEKMAAALGPKDKDGTIKKNIRQFLIDHASSIDAAGNAANTFTAGATRDTADMAAGFTSPLSLGTVGLGKAGRVGKVVAPLVGTAFGLQGLGQAGEGAQKLARTTTWENLKHGYLDPDAVQQVLGGTGQAVMGATAPIHGAGDLTDFAREKARPVMKTVGGQEVPVRAEGTVANAVQKSVSPEVNQAAAAKTQAAVQEGIGNVVGEGVGSEASTRIANQDRLGLRSHAADLKEAATDAMDELNRQSNGDYEDAKDMVEKSKRDFTTEGRDNYETSKALLNDIIEQHRQSMKDAGFDVDEMSANYRKSIAVEKIASRMESATGPLEGGKGYEVKGDRLAKVIDDMRKVPGHENPSLSKNLFERAGLTEDHINALADLADTLRDQQETPKFGSLTKLAAKAISIAATTHTAGASGLTGLFEGLTGEKAGEVVGSKVMTKLFGDALTSEPLAKELNQKLKGGVASLSTWDKFQSAVKDAYEKVKSVDLGGEEGAVGHNVVRRNVGEPLASKFSRGTSPATPINETPMEGMKVSKRENGDWEFQHPNGTSQMVLHPEADTRPGFEGKQQLRQTGISAVDAPGAGQEMMDDAVARMKNGDNVSRIISDYPDRRSPDNEGHWSKLGRRGHEVKTEGSTDSFGQPWEDWVDPAAETDLNGGKSGSSYFIDNEKAQAKPTGETEVPGRNPDSEIATREMTWKEKGETQREPNSKEHVTGWDAIEQGEKTKPGYMRDLLDKMLSYKDNGIKLTPEQIADPRLGLKAVIDHLAENVSWLHDAMPAPLREIAKQWYDSAHVMAKDIAAKNGTTPEKVAATIAALSPQNPWDMNVGQADRLIKMHQNMQDHPFTPQMDAQLSKEIGTATENENPEFAQELQALRGKTLADLKGDPYKQALLMRVLDRAHGAAETPVYAPDGKIRSYQRFNWGLLDPMAKGISILEGDGSPQSIHEVIGDGHKIRNFYNNIISPNSEGGHATIDTHHVNADMLKPMSSKNDVEVKDNFGGSPKNGEVGLKGTYAVHHEALKQAAASRGILPREMQSIVWEGIRTLMGESKKAAMRPQVNEIWQQYQNGDLTLNQARERIVKAAGGFQDPIWAKERANAKSNAGSNEAGKSPTDAGELPVLDVRRKAAVGTGPGSGSQSAASVPTAGTGAIDALEGIRKGKGVKKSKGAVPAARRIL
jgi:hypothetical protein